MSQAGPSLPHQVDNAEQGTDKNVTRGMSQELIMQLKLDSLQEMVAQLWQGLKEKRGQPQAQARPAPDRQASNQGAMQERMEHLEGMVQQLLQASQIAGSQAQTTQQASTPGDPATGKDLESAYQVPVGLLTPQGGRPSMTGTLVSDSLPLHTLLSKEARMKIAGGDFIELSRHRLGWYLHYRKCSPNRNS